MSETQYVRAGSISQAIDALKAANGDGVIIAGGVVVSSLLNQRLASPAVLVDITRIGALKIIKADGGGLSIGALVTHSEILSSPEIQAAAPLLSEIAEEISCPRLRNRGTLGGSICTIGGQGDPATGLIALGATINIKGAGGGRTVALEDFYNDAFKVDLAPDEIVESLSIPPMKPGARFAFYKHGPRNAMDFTQITTSLVFSPLDDGGFVARIGMNGVGYTPNRPRDTEALLTGTDPEAIDWLKVEQAIAKEVEPQGDLVYSANFKRHLAGVTLRRAFKRAMSKSGYSGVK
jgi:aerobic carbon-monoxide dehydrogenase medium subunit